MADTVDKLTTDTALLAPAAALKTVESKGMSSNVRVPFDSLRKMPGFNVRAENDEYRAAVRSYADSMKVNGFYDHKPLGVFKVDGQDGLFIHDGHTRYDAVALARSEGAQIDEVPVALAPAGTTVEDLTVSLVQSNEGRPLAPIELAAVVKRLLSFKDDKNWVAERIGKTVRYIDNLLVLAGAPAAVRDAVANNRIAAAEAVKIVRKDPKTAADTVKAKVKEAEAKGKAKATPKTSAPAVPAGPKMKRVVVEIDVKKGDKLGDVLKDSVAKAIRAEFETSDETDLVEDEIGKIVLTLHVPDYEAIQAATAAAAAKAKAAEDRAAAKVVADAAKAKAAEERAAAKLKADAEKAKAAAAKPAPAAKPAAAAKKPAVAKDPAAGTFVAALKAAGEKKPAAAKPAKAAAAAKTPAPAPTTGDDGMGGL